MFYTFSVHTVHDHSYCLSLPSLSVVSVPLNGFGKQTSLLVMLLILSLFTEDNRALLLTVDNVYKNNPVLMLITTL